MKDTKKDFALTDGCMWEKNKQAGTRQIHSIEVMDIKTGQVRFIDGGSIIRFVSGNISEIRNQEDYNRLTDEENEKQN